MECTSTKPARKRARKSWRSSPVIATKHSSKAAYQSSAKLFEQVPLVNREGMDVQVKDAVSRKPGSYLKVDDLVDDSLVLELEKEGFISRIYKQ